MEIVKTSASDIRQAVKILKTGGVIIFPTDTAYAIGGIFNSPNVIKQVLEIKKRTDQKFTVVASDLSQVKKFFKLNQQALELGGKYWPGPLSIAVGNKYAVRVPANKVARRLAKLAATPLIASSANISGSKTLYDPRKVLDWFKDKKNQPELMIDAGQLKANPVSTIIAVKKDKILVLRSGQIKLSAKT
ncbi:MAG: L-threonylcarbamoyladenylate synthase [Patescibacteria group bacterium]|nr:L-threonylcarbamoyladenylate synthase [Patescibacteria group bacterium]